MTMKTLQAKICYRQKGTDESYIIEYIAKCKKKKNNLREIICFEKITTKNKTVKS